MLNFFYGINYETIFDIILRLREITHQCRSLVNLTFCRYNELDKKKKHKIAAVKNLKL